MIRRAARRFRGKQLVAREDGGHLLVRLDKMGESLKKKIVSSVADALYDASLKPAVEAFSGGLRGVQGFFIGWRCLGRKLRGQLVQLAS